MYSVRVERAGFTEIAELMTGEGHSQVTLIPLLFEIRVLGLSPKSCPFNCILIFSFRTLIKKKKKTILIL